MRGGRHCYLCWRRCGSHSPVAGLVMVRQVGPGCVQRLLRDSTITARGGQGRWTPSGVRQRGPSSLLSGEGPRLLFEVRSPECSLVVADPAIGSDVVSQDALDQVDACRELRRAQHRRHQRSIRRSDRHSMPSSLSSFTRSACSETPLPAPARLADSTSGGHLHT